MSFLTARWNKLAFANYPVEGSLLHPYLPAQTELDEWRGQPYVSLIGFMFEDVRLLGIKVPFHVNFEEVNLRFYVRRRVGGKWRRGVVFIKEIVPKHAITFVANTLYGEAYETRRMHHRWKLADGRQTVAYSWRVGPRWQTFGVEAQEQWRDIPVGTEAEFITEHYWGYSRSGATKTTEYEVTHPRWRQAQVLSHTIDVDFDLNYGSAFRFLNDRRPTSVFLAEGSPITIEGKRTLK